MKSLTIGFGLLCIAIARAEVYLSANQVSISIQLCNHRKVSYDIKIILKGSILSKSSVKLTIFLRKLKDNIILQNGWHVGNWKKTANLGLRKKTCWVSKFFVNIDIHLSTIFFLKIPFIVKGMQTCFFKLAVSHKYKMINQKVWNWIMLFLHFFLLFIASDSTIKLTFRD